MPIGQYIQSLPNTTTSFQHATLMENKISKTRSTTKEKKRDRGYHHDSDDVVANTSDSHNNTFQNVDTTKSHDSDEHGNDTNDDCNNTNSNSMQPSNKIMTFPIMLTLDKTYIRIILEPVMITYPSLTDKIAFPL